MIGTNTGVPEISSSSKKSRVHETTIKLFDFDSDVSISDYKERETTMEDYKKKKYSSLEYSKLVEDDTIINVASSSPYSWRDVLNAKSRMHAEYRKRYGGNSNTTASASSTEADDSWWGASNVTFAEFLDVLAPGLRTGISSLLIKTNRESITTTSYGSGSGSESSDLTSGNKLLLSHRLRENLKSGRNLQDENVSVLNKLSRNSKSEDISSIYDVPPLDDSDVFFITKVAQYFDRGASRMTNFVGKVGKYIELNGWRLTLTFLWYELFASSDSSDSSGGPGGATKKKKPSAKDLTYEGLAFGWEGVLLFLEGATGMLEFFSLSMLFQKIVGTDANPLAVTFFVDVLALCLLSKLHHSSEISSGFRNYIQITSKLFLILALHAATHVFSLFLFLVHREDTLSALEFIGDGGKLVGVGIAIFTTTYLVLFDPDAKLIGDGGKKEREHRIINLAKKKRINLLEKLDECRECTT